MYTSFTSCLALNHGQFTGEVGVIVSWIIHFSTLESPSAPMPTSSMPALKRVCLVHSNLERTAAALNLLSVLYMANVKSGAFFDKGTAMMQYALLLVGCSDKYCAITDADVAGKFPILGKPFSSRGKVNPFS